MTTASMIHQLRLELWNLSYLQWKTQTLFSIQWWSLIALIIFSYVIWWLTVDKRRLTQILLFGALIAVGRVVMDIIGSNVALWSYDIRETPFTPSPFLHDLTLTPLALMAAYQYSHSWKSFFAWTVVATGIITFVFFPLLTTLGFLTYYNWNHVYSFVLIIGIASLSRWVLLGVITMEQNYGYAKYEARTLKFQPAMKPLDKGRSDQEDQP